MKKKLAVSVGQYSDAGIKPVNQDFHGVCIPNSPSLGSKGITVAIADGISSSDVSHIASETAVKGFIEDYYCTSDAWSVKTAAQKVLRATNSWLYAQARNSPHRFNKDKGYICTFSALIIKSRTAHILHSGDTRIYRLSKNTLEQLTIDHRNVISGSVSYLTRALGIHNSLEMDYRALSVEENDIFVLSTDGVHEYLTEQDIARCINQNDNKCCDKLAKKIVQLAIDAGSADNLTLQIIQINQLPERQFDEVQQQLVELPLPPPLQARMNFDGYRILREIYISSRSHVYLAEDTETADRVVIKVPSTELKDDLGYLESFLMEDWIAKRINNPHVLKAIASSRKRNYLYIVTEFIDGKNLSQWMIDNPAPSIEQVRNIVDQVVKGVQAFHRQEMFHQDIRPNNIMIDSAGTVKIIDFGSTKVAGLSDIKDNNEGIVGTMQYSAPEYFMGQPVTAKADIYSVGVIAYQMLSGHLPYGTKVSGARTKADQLKLTYHPLSEHNRSVPEWVDQTIKKAVNINPLKRYYELSEFAYDLRHPNKSYTSRSRPPLIERNPIAFWQGLSAILLLMHIWQIAG